LLGEAPAVQRARRASELLASRRVALRRVASRFSICEADADDALQRAIEILLTKGPEIEGQALLAWMQVVTRREALAVRRERSRLLTELTCSPSSPPEPFDPDRCVGSGADPERALSDRERAAEAARLLRMLKPQERRALGLQAAGCSYAEIQAITGWTYTKVNRSLSEGRARLRSLQPLPLG
jgi:RNA polymerase sigma factor (sigma-70 family)